MCLRLKQQYLNNLTIKKENPMKTVISQLAAATVLTLSASAQAWVVTPTDVSFTNQEGTTIPGKLFKPAGAGPFPVVVMMHGCSGIHSNSDTSKGVANLYREWGDRLVMQNYAALLVDSFTPRGTQNECGNGTAGISEVNQRRFDAYGAYNYLAAQTWVNANKVGILGWSHGGSSTMAVMDQSNVVNGVKPFKAAVAFYPGCGLLNAFGGVTNSTWAPYSPITIQHGTADALYSDGKCTTRVNRATQGGASASLTAYTDAKHSFDMATAVGGNFVLADVNAKSSADGVTMSHFNAYLK
jgi:dienelactone hydrolase